MSRTRAEQRRDRSRVPSRLPESFPSRSRPAVPFPAYVQATYTRAALTAEERNTLPRRKARA